MNPIIKCEHTDFGYENHDAVIDLNLEIYPGDFSAWWERMVQEKVP